jgi:hypothetical protein
MTSTEVFDQLHASVAAIKNQNQMHVRRGGLGQPGEQVPIVLTALRNNVGFTRADPANKASTLMQLRFRFFLGDGERQWALVLQKARSQLDIDVRVGFDGSGSKNSWSGEPCRRCTTC